MEMIKKILIIGLFFLSSNIRSQDFITADVKCPTFNADCLNGMIDLHINGGFPLYDVTWKRVIYHFPYPPLIIIVQHSSNIQGRNDGEDLINIIPGVYTVEVIDAQCGTGSRDFKISCEYSDDCELDAIVQPASLLDKGVIESVMLAKPLRQFPNYEVMDTVSSTTLPIANNMELDIDLYPVPTSGMIILESKDKNLGKINIHVFNVYGELVFTSKVDFSNGNSRLSINLSDLLQGAYFVSITDNHNRSVVHKAMKM